VKENEILELITSEYSWEQVIYKIIAWEGIDPWDLDLKRLSEAFLQYLEKLEELDFKIPAKYLIIAAVLLRMKSDHLEFFENLVYGDVEAEELEADIEGESISPNETRIDINPITVPARRRPTRKIIIEELVAALRKALATHERRKEKRIKRIGQIHIRKENLNERITELYRRIESILSEMKKDEIKFSKLVKKWEREEILNTFLPLIHLDNNKKVRCRQDNIFDEIFIKRMGEK